MKYASLVVNWRPIVVAVAAMSSFVVVVVVALRGGRVLFVPVTDMSVGGDYVGRCVFAAAAACWGSGGHDSGSCC